MPKKLTPDFSKASPDEIREYADQLSSIVSSLTAYDINGPLAEKIIEGWTIIWNNNKPNLQVRFG